MSKFRGARYLLCLALFFGAFGGLFGDRAVLAAQEGVNTAVLLPPGQEEEPPPVEPAEPPEEKLEVFSSYPILQNLVGGSFEFGVTLFYQGSEPKTFDLDLVVPEGWIGIFTGGYPETEISAFTVEPEKTGELIQLNVYPLPDNPPGPGEYIFTVSAFSGDVSASVDLKAVVIPAPPQYLLYMSTATLQREFSVSPNQANHISLQLTNSQSGTVNNINFSAEKPEGWNVTFTPNTLSSLESGITQEIDVVVTPPSGTEAGDYPLTLKATGDETESEREFRITVVTSTAWGGAGIAIAVAIIVVLAVWFRRSGTRGGGEPNDSTSRFKRVAARFRRAPGK